MTKVEDLLAIKKFLSIYTNKKASHNCYAYIIKEQEKYHDDKEPNKAAGAAILTVLKQQKLTNVIVLTIRYFHPPQLGIGGLIRAYQTGVINILKTIPIYQIVTSSIYDLSFPLIHLHLVNYWVNKYKWLVVLQKNDHHQAVWTVNIPDVSNIKNFYHQEIAVNFVKKSTIAILDKQQINCNNIKK